MPANFGLDPEQKLAIAEYNFAKDGGAVGDITLRGNPLPKGALIVNAFIFVETAVTSGGSATIALKTEGTDDILAATAKTSFTLSASVQGVPDLATVADYKLMTASRNVTMSIAVAALTAGKFRVFMHYVMAK